MRVNANESATRSGSEDAATSRSGARACLAATILYALIASALTGPALFGHAALGPDTLLDWDLLYRPGADPPSVYPPGLDYTPVVLELPRDSAFARGLHRGRLDSWNPLVGTGSPLWAEQGGPFFPLKLPYYLWPSRPTYTLFLTLRLAAAGLGAYLLARRRGLSTMPAMAAGAAFELSGAIVALLPFGGSSAPYLLPWVLLGSFAIAERRTALSVVAAAVAVGAAASGGHPPLVLMTLVAFPVAVLGHLASHWRSVRTMAAIGAHSLLACVLGLALAAPSLLPLHELWQVGATYKDRSVGATVHRQALRESRAALRKGLLASVPLDGKARATTVNDLVASIGTLALFAAIAGLLTPRIGAPLLAVGVLGVAITLQPTGLAAVGSLPGMRLILPKYGWTLIALVLAQAVGDGLRNLGGKRASLVGGIALGLFACVTLLLGPSPGDAGGTIRELLALRPATWLPIAAATAALGTHLLLRRTRFPRLGLYALLVLAAFEQLVTMRSVALHPASEVLSKPPSPAVRFLQARLSTGDARMTALPSRLGHPSSPMLFDLPDVRSVAALQVGRLYEYMSAIGTGAGDFTILETPATRSALLDLAAVRYYVLPAPPRTNSLEGMLVTQWPAEDDPAMPLVYRDERVVVYESSNALPRVRIVHRAEPVDHAGALRWLDAARRSGSARGAGLDDAVVIEPDEGGAVGPRRSTGKPSSDSARLLPQDDPDRLRIEAHLDEPGFVLVADTYYPGWNAWVDGARAPVFPANLLFRAVPVPRGAHTVEMRYEPASLRHGVLAFALACVAMAALVLVSKRRALD